MGQMRLSGLISGMDTDTVIQQLVSVRRLKVTRAKGDQTKLSWKQDIWKDLNKELQSLHTKFAATMRFSSAYTTKKTAVSNPAVANVIAGANAMDSVQSLKVTQLAKSGYMTGGEVSTVGDEKATALSKMSDLGFGGSGSLSLKIGGEEKATINIDSNTTISDVLSELKNAGLNASFDEKNQRLFISSKASGEEYDFTLTANDSDGNDALAKLGLQTKEYYTGLNAQSEEERTAGIAANLAERTAALNNTYQDLQARLADAQSQITTLTDALSGQDGFDSDDLDATLSRWTTQKNELASQIEATEDEEEKANLQTQLDALNEKISSAESLKSQEETAADVQARMADLEQFIDPSTGEATDALRAQVEADYDARIAAANAALSDDDAAATRYATKIKGQDAEIYLNGARFTNNTNNFSINGLTITALSKTADNEEVTLTTTNDTDGIYDNIKNFLKQYNTVINKMDALYNADSIRKYEMLTDEEKEAMSESEVKTYEDKIKDGLLRRDETIGSISSALKKVMSSGYEVDGVKMYLTSFGIGTGDYFSTPDNEKNALHIDGDPDDSMTSGNADKLKAMIASDPDKVISFFTQMSKDLYSSMSELSASRSGYRTYGTFFDDVKMKADYSDFTSKIDDLEEKANDYEDKLYAKFSAMETALAKLQSKTSALSGLIGTGN